MNKILFSISSIVILSILNSCSSDAEEAEQQSINAQNQLKTIRIEAISDLPIGPPSTVSTQIRTDYFYVTSLGGTIGLTNTVPNQIGQNTITQTFTTAPSSNLQLVMQRVNTFADVMSGQGQTDYCGDVTINVYSNDVLFFTLTKEMGGTTCPDSYYYTTNIIVPM
jgi:protein-disulfide isomerase